MKDEFRKATISESLIIDELVFTYPEVVHILFNERRQRILKLLKEGAMNIIELSKALEWNPGTVKRHIDQLLLYNLIYLSQTVKNEFGFTLKYYRASAILYKILIEWE